jgi:hypothetical protein
MGREEKRRRDEDTRTGEETYLLNSPDVLKLIL